MDPYLVAFLIVVVLFLLHRHGAEFNPVTKLCSCLVGSQSEELSEEFAYDDASRTTRMPSKAPINRGTATAEKKRRIAAQRKLVPSLSPYGDQIAPSAEFSRETFASTTENDTRPDVVALSEKGDYSDAIKNMALEPTIENSHKRFVDQAHHRTSTASKLTVRADPNDINPWIGLRRPNYRGGAQPMEDTRVISSEAPDQLHEYRKTCLI